MRIPFLSDLAATQKAERELSSYLRGGKDLYDEERRQEAERRYQPSEAELAEVGHVRKCYELASRAKDPYLRTWATAIAYFCGEQYKTWNPHSRSLVAEEELPSWRRRITDNQVKTIAVTVAAKLAKPRHITVGRPKNPDDPEDVGASSMSTKVLRHLDRITHRQKKRRKVCLLKTIYGTAFKVPYWDPRRQTQVATVDPVSGAIKGHEVHKGDQDFEVESVWTMFPQPVDDWDDVQWCVRAKRWTLDRVRDTFGEKGWLVSAEAMTDTAWLAAEFNSKTPAGAAPAAHAREDECLVLEYWEKPCKKYPKGRWRIVAGNVLLHGEDQLPHPKHRFPVIPEFGVEVPGRLWGAGWVEDIIGQQDELNLTQSQIAENRDLTSRPKYAVAREGKIADDALDSEPGEIVEWNWAGGVPAPAPITPPSMPQYVAELPDRIIARMNAITGIHEVSQASVPAGVKSGVAIDLLQQQDDDRLSMTNDAAGESWAELDEQMLESIQARYTVPRFIRVFGKDGYAEAFAFMGTDLKGNTEVTLEASEGVSDSLAAQRQRIMDYRAAGFFDLPAPLLVRIFQIMNESQLAEAVIEIATAAQEAQAQAAEAAAAQMTEPGPLDPFGNPAAPAGPAAPDLTGMGTTAFEEGQPVPVSANYAQALSGSMSQLGL